LFHPVFFISARSKEWVLLKLDEEMALTRPSLNYNIFKTPEWIAIKVGVELSRDFDVELHLFSR
jgi:hypothetical protein